MSGADLPTDRILSDGRPLWRFSRLSDFRRPEGPAGAGVRKGFLGLWDRLHGRARGEEEVMAEKDLCVLPDALMKDVLPGDGWEPEERAFEDLLVSLGEGESARQRGFVVLSTPDDGLAEGIGTFAERKGWAILPEPRQEDLLKGGSDAVESVRQNVDIPLAVPALNRFFLRHQNGLDLLRGVLEALVATGRRCMIGCDSWAWSFLSRALNLDALLKQVYALEAFDDERLHEWFGRAARKVFSRGYAFRQADNGRVVLRPATVPDRLAETASDRKGEAEVAPDGSDVTDFLRHLAARSKGMPGVAKAIWGFSLRFAYEEEVQEKAQKAAAPDRGATIWVRPWSRMSFPSLPSGRNTLALLVLHAILLHGGLKGTVLPALLPFSATRILAEVSALQGAGLIGEEEDGCWRVTPLGYPAVDDALRSEGYLAGVL